MHSVTRWIKAVKGGDKDWAVGELWKRYFSAALVLARGGTKIGAPLRDVEDIAAESLGRILLHLQSGALSDICNREQFAQLLSKIIDWRIKDARRKQRAQKRGGGTGTAVSWDELPGDGIADPKTEPPVEVVGLEDLLGWAEKWLPAEHRQIFELALEGHSRREIAHRLGIPESRVFRRMEVIRERILSQVG